MYYNQLALEHLVSLTEKLPPELITIISNFLVKDLSITSFIDTMVSNEKLMKSQLLKHTFYRFRCVIDTYSEDRNINLIKLEPLQGTIDSKSDYVRLLAYLYESCSNSNVHRLKVIIGKDETIEYNNVTSTFFKTVAVFIPSVLVLGLNFKINDINGLLGLGCLNSVIDMHIYDGKRIGKEVLDEMNCLKSLTLFNEDIIRPNFKSFIKSSRSLERLHLLPPNFYYFNRYKEFMDELKVYKAKHQHKLKISVDLKLGGYRFSSFESFSKWLNYTKGFGNCIQSLCIMMRHDMTPLTDFQDFVNLRSLYINVTDINLDVQQLVVSGKRLESLQVYSSAQSIMCNLDLNLSYCSGLTNLKLSSCTISPASFNLFPNSLITLQLLDVIIEPNTEVQLPPKLKNFKIEFRSNTVSWPKLLPTENTSLNTVVFDVPYKQYEFTNDENIISLNFLKNLPKVIHRLEINLGMIENWHDIPKLDLGGLILDTFFFNVNIQFLASLDELEDPSFQTFDFSNTSVKSMHISATPLFFISKLPRELVDLEVVQSSDYFNHYAFTTYQWMSSLLHDLSTVKNIELQVSRRTELDLRCFKNGVYSRGLKLTIKYVNDYLRTGNGNPCVVVLEDVPSYVDQIKVDFSHLDYKAPLHLIVPEVTDGMMRCGLCDAANKIVVIPYLTGVDSDNDPISKYIGVHY